MSDDVNQHVKAQPSYRAVIEKAIADWGRYQPDSLTLPIEDRALGALDLLITRSLVKAGFIDPEQRPAKNSPRDH